MIPLNYIFVKSSLEDTIANNKTKISNIKNNINSISSFSNILEINSITKLEFNSKEENILYLIKTYETIYNTNDYNDFKCPLCKNKNCLVFHKTYQRNIIFHLYDYEISAIINLVVVECTICKHKHNNQHFHSLMPDFIFPYHIYSSNIILNVLYDRLINKTKIETILNNIRISHQLFYKWINGFIKYKVAASSILSISLKDDLIIKSIIEDIYIFLYNFYQNYFHPFFLFRLTCVPLIITP